MTKREKKDILKQIKIEKREIGRCIREILSTSDPDKFMFLNKEMRERADSVVRLRSKISE